MDAFELYRDEGKNFRSVLARIDSDHFCIETQDMGPTTDEFWGDADYEFWTKVPKEAWGDLLMAIAKEFLVGDARATDRLRDIYRKHDVKHEWDRWV
jgi:hypothetical protein